MERIQIITQSSPWYILLCLLAGALYAFILYQKKPSWSTRLNYGFAALRFVVVSLLCLLLLSPIVKQIKSTIEKPIIVYAIDNSRSIKETNDSASINNTINGIKSISKDLENDFEISYENLNGKNIDTIDSIRFNQPVTNLSALLNNIQSEYENRNISGVVLLSDGIYNQGVSPDYFPYNFTIFPIAMGDTIPKKDINLKKIYYNRVAYRNNQFPIVAEFSSEGFAGRNIAIQLLRNGEVIEKKATQIKANSDLQQVTFYASSDKPGLQHFVVRIVAEQEEFSQSNNTGHAFVDVIDNKEKILLVAFAPHPDIKAIRNALETKENYEFQVYIQGIGEMPKNEKYDLVIFHQVPDMYNQSAATLARWKALGNNFLYIIGSQSNLPQFNLENDLVNLTVRRGQKDEVFPVLNPAFDKFKIEVDNQSRINNFSPVSVPFVEIKLLGNAEVILTQRIGSIESSKPLLVVGSANDKKTGVFIGDGFWNWRMNEFAETGKQQAFDELFTKLVQYLSAKEDKRKFRVYPLSNELFDNEEITFETEVYNAIYEKIYGQKVEMTVTSETGEKKNYSYVNSPNNSRLIISGLPVGIYKYTATTILEGQTVASGGEFTVKELQLEALNTTADHNLLKQLANNSNGKLFFPAQIDQLKDYLQKNKLAGKLHSTEENLELIHMKLIFFLILILISLEWAGRKYSGAY